MIFPSSRRSLLRALRLSRVVVLIAPCLAAVGCAESARRIAHEATPGGMEGALQAMAKPENRQTLNLVIADPAVHMGRGLGQGIVETVLASIGVGGGSQFASAAVAAEPGASPTTAESAASSTTATPATGPETANTVAAGSSAAGGAATQPSTRPTLATKGGESFANLGRGFDTQVKPRIEETVRGVVAAGLKEAFAPPQRDAASEFARQIAAESADETTRHLAAGIRDQIGPAIRDAMTRDVGPAIRAAIEKEIRPALQIEGAGNGSIERAAGNTARLVSREATLGLRDALRDMGVVQQDGSISPSLTGKPKGMLAQTLDLAGLIAIAFGLLVIGLVVFLFVVLAKARRSREQAREHEANARRLTEALRGVRDRPWGRELEAMLRDKLGPDPFAPTARAHAGQRAGE